MRSIESEGDTIDQAIERALRALDVARDQVQIEILSDATRGLLGFGGTKARVRATVRPPLASRLLGLEHEARGGRTVALPRAFFPPNPSKPRVASLRISICTWSRATSSARRALSMAWSMVSPSLSIDRISSPHFMDRIMKYCCPMVSRLLINK